MGKTFKLSDKSSAAKLTSVEDVLASMKKARKDKEHRFEKASRMLVLYAEDKAEGITSYGYFNSGCDLGESLVLLEIMKKELLD